MMHVGNAYPRWRGKRSQHPLRLRTRNFTFLARGPWKYKQILISTLPAGVMVLLTSIMVEYICMYIYIYIYIYIISIKYWSSDLDKFGWFVSILYRLALLYHYIRVINVHAGGTGKLNSYAEISMRYIDQFFDLDLLNLLNVYIYIYSLTLFEYRHALIIILHRRLLLVFI